MIADINGALDAVRVSRVARQVIGCESGGGSQEESMNLRPAQGPPFNCESGCILPHHKSGGQLEAPKYQRRVSVHISVAGTRRANDGNSQVLCAVTDEFLCAF